MRAIFASLALVAGAWPAMSQEDLPKPIAINPAAVDELTFDQLTVCNGDDQWAPNLQAASEWAAIKAARGVHRSGEVLRIGAARFVGKAINNDTGAGVTYAYVGRYRAMPLAVISVAYFDGGGFAIVDPRTAGHIDTAALPLPGPGGHVLAAATRSEAYNDPAIQLIEWRDGRLTSTDLDTPTPCGLNWVSPDELGFKVSIDPQNKAPVHLAPARVRRVDGRWIYEGPAPVPPVP